MAIQDYNTNDKAGKMTTETDKAIAGWWAKVLADARNNPFAKTFYRDLEEVAEFLLSNSSDYRNYFISLKDINKASKLEGDMFVTSNRVDEYVRTILSEIHFRNPDRFVRVRSPMGEDYLSRKLHAESLESLLNYRAERSDLYQEQRQAFVDGLLSGLSVQKVCLDVDEDDGRKVVRTECVPIVDFLMDGSCKNLQNVPWMAKRCEMPKAKFVKLYGKKADKLFSEKSNPMEKIVYWEIYSKVGAFGGIRNSDVDERIQKSVDKKHPKYVKVVIVEKEYYKPENERNTGDQDDGIGPARLVSISKWEVPFYKGAEEANDFPFILDYFGNKFGSVYPVSPLKSGLPTLRAINRIISKIASYIENLRTTLQVSPQVTNQQLNEIKKKKTFSVIKGSMGDDLFKMVSIDPDVGPLLAALEQYEAMFDRRVGLEAIRYITGSQSRSSADAQARMSVASRALEQHAAAAEGAMNKAARKEAFVWRVKCTGKDILPIVGEMQANFWDEYVVPTREKMTKEYDVNVRADAARLPNRSADRQMRIAFAQKAQNLAGQMQDLQTLNYWLMVEWMELSQAPEEFQPIQPPPGPSQDMLMAQMGQSQQSPQQQGEG